MRVSAIAAAPALGAIRVAAAPRQRLGQLCTPRTEVCVQYLRPRFYLLTREAGNDEDIEDRSHRFLPRAARTVSTAPVKEAEMPGMTPPGEHPVFGTAAATSTV